VVKSRRRDRKKKPIHLDDHDPGRQLPLRRPSTDPVTIYKNRGIVTGRQFIAAETFGGQYRRAYLAGVYTQVRYENMPRSGMPGEASVAVQHAKEKVRAALGHVGYPLAGIIEHVVGEGLNAGTWKGVIASRRPDQDGMVALRLGLDGLVNYYGI
jgi:hypothetical protein